MKAEDLALVPINTLIDEIFGRTKECVISFTIQDDPGYPKIFTQHKSPDSSLAVLGLLEYTKDDVIQGMHEENDNE